jgi:hypothetical protein
MVLMHYTTSERRSRQSQRSLDSCGSIALKRCSYLASDTIRNRANTVRPRVVLACVLFCRTGPFASFVASSKVSEAFPHLLLGTCNH